MAVINYIGVEIGKQKLCLVLKILLNFIYTHKTLQNIGKEEVTNMSV